MKVIRAVASAVEPAADTVEVDDVLEGDDRKKALAEFNQEVTSCYALTPAGELPSSLRLVLSSDKLVLRLKTLEKTGTSRAWCKQTISRWMAKLGRIVRVQTNYAYDTIVGWVRLVAIERINIGARLNIPMLNIVGCKDMCKDTYIQQYWGGDYGASGVLLHFTFIPYHHLLDPHVQPYQSLKTGPTLDTSKELTQLNNTIKTLVKAQEAHFTRDIPKALEQKDIEKIVRQQTTALKSSITSAIDTLSALFPSTPDTAVLSAALDPQLQVNPTPTPQSAVLSGALAPQPQVTPTPTPQPAHATPPAPPYVGLPPMHSQHQPSLVSHQHPMTPHQYPPVHPPYHPYLPMSSYYQHPPPHSAFAYAYVNCQNENKRLWNG